MTEYWVSQGNKWCDFCKIFLQNNPTSIRNHELGKRHKEAVNLKLSDMREKSAAKEKELKQAARTLEQIEVKANRSYQKDIATGSGKSNTAPDDDEGEWEPDSTSGYSYNKTNGLYYDSNSGFYYSDAIGKWVSQEEAYAAIKVSSHNKAAMKKPLRAGPVSENKNAANKQNGTAPAPIILGKRTAKGARPSSVDLGKRKRQYEKPKKISTEEAAALKAREAARKRVEEREKPLLGLYGKNL